VLGSSLGKSLTSTTAKLLNISRDDVGAEGPGVLSVGWTASKWLEVFNAVPGLPEPEKDEEESVQRKRGGRASVSVFGTPLRLP
jgi:hypothetical protein